MEMGNKIKNAWHWLWHSDSILSWVLALIIAFIAVRFVFFPLISLALGTPLPLVVVESSSMEHPEAGFFGNLFATQGSFDAWWKEKGAWYEQNGFTKQQVESWSLRTGFDKGDIILVYGRFTPKIGDVVIFNANTEHPIIHRIVAINGDIISTKGDNNDGQLSIERSISREDLVGKAVFRIPKLGWIKLVFVNIISGFS